MSIKTSQKFKDLLDDVQTLDKHELNDFVQHVLRIRAQKVAPSLNEQETELFQRINLGLNDEQRKRMNELVEKRQKEVISSQDLQELISLTTLAEQLNVERLKALGQLSRLRKVGLNELMDELGIKSQPYV